MSDDDFKIRDPNRSYVDSPPESTKFVEEPNPLEEELFNPLEEELFSAPPPAPEPEAPPRPLTTPWADKPWHQQWADVAKDVVHSPQFSFIENITPWSDEASANMMNTEAPYRDAAQQAATDIYGADQSKWPENAKKAAGAEQVPTQQERKAQATAPSVTQPNRYKAGSQAEDTRKVLSGEKDERSGENLKSAIAGGLGGGVFENMLTGGAGIVENAASMVADQLGEGTGDVGERASQAVERFKNAPWWSKSLLGLGLLAPGIVPVARKAKTHFDNKAFEKTVDAAIPVAQQEVIYKNSKLPREVVKRKLGQEMRRLGLHETGNLSSPDAETFYNNAVKAEQAAEQGLDVTEKQIVGQGNPPIQYTPISEDLEATAKNMGKLADQTAAKSEIDLLNQLAQDYRNATKVPSGARKAIPPTPEEYADYAQAQAEHAQKEAAQQTAHAKKVDTVKKQNKASQKQYEKDLKQHQEDIETPPFFSSGKGREYTPSKKELDAYERQLKAREMPEPPQTIRYDAPAQPQRPVNPEEWEAYARQAEQAPPVEVKAPPKKVLDAYRRKVAKAKKAQAEPLPEKPEPGLYSGPERPSKIDPATPPPTKVATVPPPPPPQPITVPPPPRARIEPVPDVETGVRNFADARTDQLYNNQQRDFSRIGKQPMPEKVRGRLGVKLREQIRGGLEDAVTNKQVDAPVVENWKQHMQDYSTAATVKDPALALMLKELGGSKSMADLADAGVLAAFGVPGFTAAKAAKKVIGKQPGRAANQYERIADAAANTESAANIAASRPIAGAVRAQQKAAAVKAANDSLKAEMQRQADEDLTQGQQVIDWFKTWIK